MGTKAVSSDRRAQMLMAAAVAILLLGYLLAALNLILKAT